MSSETRARLLIGITLMLLGMLLGIIIKSP